MERYYKILGIPSNATKIEIKKAYHEKMKTLHPDKVHGTSLEDTATFFSVEINEAYDALMSQFNNVNTSSTRKKQIEYLEEEIYVGKLGLLKYSMSNDLGVILDVITKQTGYTVSANDSMAWDLNLYLCENVKRSMNKHNMNYSMTINLEGAIRYIIINKRVGKDWYIVIYRKNTEYHTKRPSTRNKNIYTGHYRYNTSNSPKASMSKVGFFIGVLNLLHLFFVYMNRQSITLPEDDRTLITFAWGIITLVLAITGFLLSKKGYSEQITGIGYGIAGMAINGLVILPALIFFLTLIFSSKNNKRK